MVATYQMTFDKTGEVALHLQGPWTTSLLVAPATIYNQILSHSVKLIRIDASAITDWDSSLINFIFQIRLWADERELRLELNALPEGASRLLNLALAVPEREGAGRKSRKPSFLARIGKAFFRACDETMQGISFAGEVIHSCVRTLTGKGAFPFRDFLTFFQQGGPEAFLIVSLISFLVGVILAFVGAIQLQMFGAEIYVANLVGIGIVRSLGAVMAGIVMSGRTGAAYAAQLGTMQVNQEIDALETMGISPVDYLVLPRLLALVLTLPMLCLVANVMGILGGAVIGIFMLDISAPQYYLQTIASIRLNDFWVGLVLSLIFGFLVAGAGCLRGLQCGRSSAAVGKATTSAVVTSIVSIIVATAVITVICSVLGI
ncbi:MAG: ABC transporter permease [Lentisphaeria bacterium]|nr:ABC transporter permease [Lentisphaeria bacterium]